MRHVACPPRPEWRRRVAEAGVVYHSTRGPDGITRPYWDESRRYEFAPAEARELYRAAEDCQAMLIDCLDAVLGTGSDAELARYGVPPLLVAAARRSWAEEWPLITTRMDFSYDGGGPARLLEWNCDTAMTGVETAFGLPDWLADVAPGADQANRLHAATVEVFAALAGYLRAPLWFLSGRHGDDEAEALLNVTWLRSAAEEAGLRTRQAFLEDLAFGAGRFSYHGEPIEAAYKQYLYAYIAGTPAERNLAEAMAGPRPSLWLNAPYAAALGAKGLLALAWQRHRDHPNLLPTHVGTPAGLRSFARKPLASHDSRGVSLHRDGRLIAGTPGPGPDADHVFQQLAPLPDLGGGHAVVSVWLAGTEAAALAVRDSDGPLTYGQQCRFVPHLLDEAAG